MGRVTHEHGFREGENLILGQEAVLIFVVDVEEPFDIIHQVVEHHTVQS